MSVERKISRAVAVMCVCAIALVGASATAGPGYVEVAAAKSCKRPSGVVTLTFSARKYPNIRRHALAAIRKGWPRILVLDRPGASGRRKRLLEYIPTRAGYDRDEYPPAVGRGVGPGLTKGSNPTGWKADFMYVPSHENRSHGSSMGGKLRKYCNGTRFRYAFN